MGYKQFLREVQAAERRAERDSLRRHRELVKQAERRAKENEKAAAANDVWVFENYLEVLLSVHKDCGEQVSWRSWSIAPAPVAPEPGMKWEVAARQKLADYKPGFLARLFGAARKRTAALEAEIAASIGQDAEDHKGALATHKSKVKIWEHERNLASGVLKKDVAEYRRALDYLTPFSELAAFKVRVAITAVEPEFLGLNCLLEDEELVPREELKLTAGGKVSEKEMAAAKYWALHQDFVCSCAIRAARESFAALPVNRVIVNVEGTRMDTSTGHVGTVTLLAISFGRAEIQRLNMETIDPSDSLRNFHHRMKFKKSAGFEPVEPITPDEQWVTT